MTENVFTITDDGVSYDHYLPDSETDHLQRQIRDSRAPYEREMLRDMASRLRPGDTVFDVGANVGNHTIYLAHRVGCHVVAFEPNTHLSDAITFSARLNGLSDLVSVRNVAVGDNPGLAHFERDIPENLGAQRIEVGTGPITVTTLDSLEPGAPVAMVKIDVEGFEVPVLRGAREMIARDRPILYVECQGTEQFRAVSDMLHGMDYVLGSQFNATPTHLFLPAERVDLNTYSREIVSGKTVEIYRLLESYTATREALVATSDKYRALGTRVNEARQANLQQQASVDQAITSSDAGIAALRQEVADLGGTIREREVRIAALGQEVSALGVDVEARDAAIAALRQEVSALGDTAREREARISALDHEVSTQAATLGARDLAITALRQETHALGDALAEREARIAALDREVSALGASVAARDAGITALRQEIAALGDALQERKGRIAALGNEVSTLGGKVGARDTAIAALRQEISALDETVQEREARLAALDLQVSTLGGTVEARDAAIAALRQEIAALGDAVQERESRIAALGQEVSTLGVTVDTRDAAIAALRQEIGALGDSVREREARIAALSQEVSSLGATVEARDAGLAAFRREIGALGEAVLDREARLDALGQEVSATLGRLEKAEAAQRVGEDRLIVERRTALAERKAALAERNIALAERNAILADRDEMRSQLANLQVRCAATQEEQERTALRAQQLERAGADAQEAIRLLETQLAAESDKLREAEDRVQAALAKNVEDLAAARAYAIRRDNVALGAKRRMELELQAAHAVTRRELTAARRDLENRAQSLAEVQRNLAATRRELAARETLRRHLRLSWQRRFGRAQESAAERARGGFASAVLALHDTRVIRVISDAFAPRGVRRKLGDWLRRRSEPLQVENLQSIPEPLAPVPRPALVVPAAAVPTTPPAALTTSALQVSAAPALIDAPLPAADAPVRHDPATALADALAGADFIALVSAYPGAEGAYGGEFIRTRVNAYARAGLNGCVVELNARNREPRQDATGTVPVFRLPVTESDALVRRLSAATGTVLVHSPSPQMQALLPVHISGKRLVYWFHGFELRDYRRLYYNYSTGEREKLRAALDLVNRQRWEAAATTFANPDIRVIFVSEFLRDIAARDVGSLPARAHVIHNFIDGDFYDFVPADRRGSGKILLLRPFKQRNYAGDIATHAVRLLADRPGFDRLSFTIRGFGTYFGPETECLRGLDNVTVQEQYSSGDEMKALYASHDIALCPTRHDTQGVSLGEAMAAGMACISHRVAAIPEFADQDAALLVRPDDVRAYADAIWDLAHDRPRIARIGAVAAERVRRQCGFSATIRREIALLQE